MQEFVVKTQFLCTTLFLYTVLIISSTYTKTLLELEIGTVFKHLGFCWVLFMQFIFSDLRCLPKRFFFTIYRIDFTRVKFLAKCTKSKYLKNEILK